MEREKRRSRHGKKEMGREAREGGLGLITLCNVMGIALGGPSYFNYLALRNCDCKVNFITLLFNEPNIVM